ncbi:unnamed protein product [Linum tenue]|uniref:Thioredoxin-dependent peroxiredoxin n=1 Tax=Linum tenue TaxID=586396 RepID=A0AAV0S0R1_9ROSI|nr:unnamed protein product [Linum tenue]
MSSERKNQCRFFGRREAQIHQNEASTLGPKKHKPNTFSKLHYYSMTPHLIEMNMFTLIRKQERKTEKKKKRGKRDKNKINRYSAMAAVVPTVVVASNSGGSAFLHPLRHTFAATSSFLRSSWKHSDTSFHSLQLNSRRRFAVPARKFVVRAARMESKRASLGSKAPAFELPEPLTGKTWKLEDFESYPGLLKGLAVVAISSNSLATHPQDGPESMAEDAKLFDYPFPYLFDESQEVARDFRAVCTPEFFLYKKDGRRPFELVYHGQFDDSRPNSNVPVTGRDLSRAIDCVLSGQPVPSVQKPSIGCSIKWHPGKDL